MGPVYWLSSIVPAAAVALLFNLCAAQEQVEPTWEPLVESNVER
jgi:hypothetical protein